MSRREFYLPRIVSVWPTLADLVADLGVRVIRELGRRHAAVGDAPAFAQLYRGGVVFWPADMRLDAYAWSRIAHEAVHHHVGRWSINDEGPMLPFELELYRRVESTAQRRACLDFMGGTSIDDWDFGRCSDVLDLVVQHRREWVESPAWVGMREAAEHYGLPLDGTLATGRRRRCS